MVLGATLSLTLHLGSSGRDTGVERATTAAAVSPPGTLAESVVRLQVNADGSLTARDLSDRYGTTDVDGSRPDAWGYIRDHGFGDKRADLIPNYR